MSKSSTRHYERKKQAGLCTKCGQAKAETNKTRCGSCRQKASRQQSSYKREAVVQRRAAGLCRDCGKVAVDWIKNSRCTDCAKSNKAAVHRHNLKVRDEVFAAYGGYTCSCCGETKDKRFMHLDHINNDGAAQRREIGAGSAVYYWAKKHGFPPVLQPLCADCNMAKGLYGECPHAAQRQNMLVQLSKIPLEY